MKKQITFIGAGSFTFTRNLVRDILTFPAFEDCTIMLMDIDEERLKGIEKACNKLVSEGGYSADVKTTLDRREALKNADGVVITILAGDVDVWRYDIEIPEKYGVDVCVGDTRGVSGIFRALRTIPVMLDICKDIQELCPEAIVLNYTNPMAMLCRAMQEKFPKLRLTGLCHSVQGVSERLARHIGAPMEEISYVCAGLNHQAHFLEFKWNGEDAYPLLRKVLKENKEMYNEEPVMNDMFFHFGYYVTESSGHNSEYVPWYRKRKDLIEKYIEPCTAWITGEHAFTLKQYEKQKFEWQSMVDEWMNNPADLARGHEYAAYIFNAVFGDNTPFKFNGNIRNFGIIDNLPEGACIESPVLASKDGLEYIRVGKLPPQLALMNNISAQIEEMAVEACLTGNSDLVYQACYFDPLTAAVCSLEEIKQMVDELFEINKDYLTTFVL